MKTIALASLSACLVLSLAPLARAQEGGDFDKKADDAIASDKQMKDEAGKKMPGEKDKPKTDDAGPVNPKYDPKEDPSKSYKFIGGGFRDFIVPKFLINLFASGGTTVNVFEFRPVELTMRKDGFEYEFAIGYWDFSANPFLAKGKSDGDEAYELIASSMKALGVTMDVMFVDVPLDKEGRLDFMLGAGVGIMGIFGNLYRSQAFPNQPTNTNARPANPNDPSQWTACPGQPGVAGSGANGSIVTTNGVPYCDGSNGHYTTPNSGPWPNGSYSEPSWANGGSKPFIMPYISLPQLSLRFKPIKQLQTRADAGFSMYGFYLGLSAGYGFSP